MYSSAAQILMVAMQDTGKWHNPEMFRIIFCLTLDDMLKLYELLGDVMIFNLHVLDWCRSHAIDQVRFNCIMSCNKPHQKKWQGSVQKCVFLVCKWAQYTVLSIGKPSTGSGL